MEQLLRSLFDYQGFAGHPGLEARIDETARKYLGEELPDEWLDLAAAGEPEGPPPEERRPPHGQD